MCLGKGRFEAISQPAHGKRQAKKYAKNAYNPERGNENPVRKKILGRDEKRVGYQA